MTTNHLLQELSRYSLGTFADIIYRNAILHPDDEAFVYGSERVTFSQFNARVNRLIQALHGLNVHKGGVIGVLSWNRLEYSEVFGAAMKGGFVIAHYNPRLKADELIHVINDSKATLVFVSSLCFEVFDSIRDQLTSAKSFIGLGGAGEKMKTYGDLLAGQSDEEPNMDVGEDDPLVIFYTSGTTGVPRGSIYSHRQKMENTIGKALDIGVSFGDRHLVVLPMFHIGGDSHIWPFFLKGGCNVIMTKRSFDPALTLETIVEEQITDVHIVPTQLVSLLTLPDIDQFDLGCLKRIWYAASPMPTEVLLRGLSTFGPIFMQGYGQTESGPDVTVLSKADHFHSGESAEARGALASCGRPCIGVHVRIVDDNGHDLETGKIGEIIVQSKRIMTGYYQRPEETREKIQDGWLYTGDLGYYDERGFIYIADRKQNIIITGGENVYPLEVENVLYRHPAVREAAVIGTPDPYWVEKVTAIIVLKEGAQATEEDIISFCRECIAHYKAPKGVEFVESLPKNPQGKILKKDIRARYMNPQTSVAEGSGKDKSSAPSTAS